MKETVAIVLLNLVAICIFTFATISLAPSDTYLELLYSQPSQIGL